MSFGFLMSIVSSLFVRTVNLLTLRRETEFANIFSISTTEYSLAPLVFVLTAALLVHFTRTLFKVTKWQGPADSIYAAHRTDNELNIKSGLASTLAALISASGGASVGQYGPLVHFGATMGSAVRQLSRGVLTTDIFIGCGVAGAIAAGFGAPLAAIIFAHEAILRHFSLRAVAPIAISSVSASWFSNHLFNQTKIFDLNVGELDLGTFLPIALLTGPIFALVAILFMNSIRLSSSVAQKSPTSPLQNIILAAVVVGTCGIFLPQVLGLGTGPLNLILNDSYNLEFLILLFGFKLVLTAICIGFGLHGGIFSPALFVGAAAGSILIKPLSFLLGTTASTAMAVCGMVAVGSAVIGAPLTGVILIFELTMNYEFAIAAMLSTVTCIVFTNLFFGNSFFDRQLLDRGVDISLGRGHLEMMEAPIITLVSSNYIGVKPNMTCSEAISLLLDANQTEAYLISDNFRFLGKVSLHNLVNQSPDHKVNEFSNSNALSIKSDASLQQAIEIASGFVGESIPVIDRASGVLKGVITEADIFKKYLELQGKVTDLEKS